MFTELFAEITLHTIIKSVFLLLAFIGFDVPHDIVRNVETVAQTIDSSRQQVETTTQSNTRPPAAKISTKDSVQTAFISSSSNDSGEIASLPPETTTDENPDQGGVAQAVVFQVTDVIDGDTIKVTDGKMVETIRIIGINTPETVAPNRRVECFGKEASKKAKELLLGTYVELQNDTTQDNRDKYSRLLRYVSIDGVDYGLEMIRSGYAYEYTYQLPYVYQKEYKEAQVYARNNSEGLWSVSACNGKK